MPGCLRDMLVLLLLVRVRVSPSILYCISGNAISRERPVGLRVENIEIQGSEVIRRVRSPQSSGRMLSETVPRDRRVILLKDSD